MSSANGSIGKESHVLLQLGIDIGGTSVKAAALRNGEAAWTGRSAVYAQPNRSTIERAIAEATAQLRGIPDAVGLCVPGLLDERRSMVVQSMNLPGIIGVPFAELLSQFHGRFEPLIASDANATAYDIYVTRKLSGRLLALVIGTGVGAAVLDDGGRFLQIDGDSPGHLGQCDVSIAGEDVIGPDGGAGSLEGYFGAAALASRYGSVEAALREMKPTDAPFRALARIIRIAHSIYRPDHVCLAGGIGIRLGHLLSALTTSVNDRLTRIARPDWSLMTGISDFHAAIGAARLARG